MAIDVKRAAEIAREHLSDVLQVPASQILLEEVELSEDQKFWLITLSYPGPLLSAAQIFAGNRSYKVVKLDANDGRLISIKIRTLVAA